MFRRWIKPRRSRPPWPGYGPWRLCCNALLVTALLASPALAKELRLLAIGDSLTAGYGLPEGEGFVAQLDTWLAERGLEEVEVVNMGVSGETTAGGRARIGWVLGDGGDAAILALGANDMLRGIEPAVSRGNLDAILTELDTAGLPVLLAGMIAPTNYGPDYKAAFDVIYRDLAEKHDALLYPFFLEGVTGDPELLQDDMLHPNAEGVARMVEGIGPHVIELLENESP